MAGPERSSYAPAEARSEMVTMPIRGREPGAMGERACLGADRGVEQPRDPPGKAMTADRAQRTLEENLAALRSAQPGVARRLAWPVDGSHVDAGPPPRYLHHKAWVPLG